MTKVRAIPVPLLRGSSDTLMFIALKNREYEFKPDNFDGDVTLDLVSGDARFERTSNRSGIFELHSDSAIFHISTGDLEKVLIIR